MIYAELLGTDLKNANDSVGLASELKLIQDETETFYDRHEIIKRVKIHNVFWIMTSCSLVGGYERLGGITLNTEARCFERNF